MSVLFELEGVDVSFGSTYKNKTVCVTGHTGFKGSWLSEWLVSLGAEVVGYALEPPTEPSHFAAIQLGSHLKEDIRGDVRSLDGLLKMLQKHKPGFIFHLAAQPLVRRAFEEPHCTVETNVMGTANLLEAVRIAGRDCIVIVITTDKVYENSEWIHAYRENDTLGGYDPYSASKACTELLVSSYRRSFFETKGCRSKSPTIAVACARGGNVIGGGDWAVDRIVPDCMKCLSQRQPIPVRNRVATRPWQHVLELLGGYLHLGAEMYRCLYQSQPVHTERLRQLCSSFNFGPYLDSNKSVLELVNAVIKHWPGEWMDASDPSAKHEARKLNLSIDKAYHLLGWRPKWNFDQTVQYTVEWYKTFYEKDPGQSDSVRGMTCRQINSFADGLEYNAP